MQDWEWIVANGSRFAEFLEAYRAGGLTDDEQFSLMEMLVQSVNDILQARQVPEPEKQPEWLAVEELLLANWKLHDTTIRYWCDSQQPDLSESFAVTGPPGARVARHSGGFDRDE